MLTLKLHSCIKLHPGGQKIHTFTLVSTSLQRPLSSCLQGGRCREVQLYTDLSRLVTLLVRVMESSERHLSVEIEESPLNKRGLS